MKLADELRRMCRKSKIVLYYDALLRDIKREAQEGGTHRVVTIADTNYNQVCKKLLNDGFTVMIYNFSEDNSSYVTYIIWDKERFDKDFAENEDVKNKKVKLHYGLVQKDGN